MAYSQVGIVNLALAHIGEGAITSMGGTDKKSILAATVYDYVLDEVLSAHELGWNFAKKDAVLAQDATAPVDTTYDYRYALPSDCIKVLRVKPDGYPYEVRAGYVLTNFDNDLENIILTYVRRETNPAMYPPIFISTFSFRLAAAMAFTLVRGSSNVQDRMMVLYKETLAKAMGVNQSEDYRPDDYDEAANTDWIDAGR